MKIEANKFKTYLEKATMNGSIFCGTFHVEKNKLYANIKNGDAIASKSFTKCQSSKKEEYNIKDVNFLIKVLNNFDGIVEIGIKENKILLFNKNNEAIITMADKEYVDGKNIYDSEKPLENMKFNYNLKLDASIFKKVVENQKLMKSGITLSTKDNILSLSVGEEGFDKLKVKQEIKFDKEISSNFTLLLEVLQVLEGNVELYLHDNNYPIKISMKKDDANYNYWIAPIVDNE